MRTLQLEGEYYRTMLQNNISAQNLFSGSITDEAIVKIKQGPNCIVEGTDEIPRTITDCSYNVNDTILITYKAKQPAIESHEIKTQ